MVAPKNKPSTCLKDLYEWVKCILLAVLIALLIRGVIFEPVEVDGISMEDTLFNGQRLIIYKTCYYFTPPKRGDIVVLQIHEGVTRFLPFLEEIPFIRKAVLDLEEVDYIKRVIGIPGDEIEIKNGRVYVNGRELNEPYAKGITYGEGAKFPLIVKKDKVFVLGDNRQNSHDSRHIGLIDIDRIKGKAVFRIWPLKDIGVISMVNSN